MGRNVLEAFKQMKERHRFIRGMLPWIGFKSVPIFYQRDVRFAGKTKYPFKKMMHFALDAIFSFSNVPLRVAIYGGLWLVFFGVAGLSFLLYLRFFTTLFVLGITAVIATVVIMAGFQIIMLGVIGEYVGRIFEEAKARPLYVVRSTKNIEHVPFR